MDNPMDSGEKSAPIATTDTPEVTEPPALRPFDADAAIDNMKRVKEFFAVMKEGEDYGAFGGQWKKPSLLKPGAQKLCAGFGLAPNFETTNRLEDFAQGIFSYEVNCVLTDKLTGMASGGGVGTCNNREGKYAKQPGASITNTLLKMAAKRAFVDATLNATGAAFIFTQDIEDIIANNEAHGQAQSAQQNNTAQGPSRPAQGHPAPGDGSNSQRAAALPQRAAAPPHSKPVPAAYTKEQWDEAFTAYNQAVEEAGLQSGSDNELMALATFNSVPVEEFKFSRCSPVRIGKMTTAVKTGALKWEAIAE